MKFDLNKEMKPWVDTINNSLKWAMALIIRIGLILLGIIMIIMLLKWTGIIKELYDLTSIDVEVIHEDTRHLSKPKILTHTSDIKDITETQKLIMDKLKGKTKNEDK